MVNLNHKGPLRLHGHQGPYTHEKISDPDYAVKKKGAAGNPQCGHSLMENVTAMLLEHEMYVPMYKTAQEKLDAQPQSIDIS